MGKYKIVVDGYIVCVGIGDRGTPITEEEYRAILLAVDNRPEDTEDTIFKLNEELEWEECERPPIPEPDLTDSEIIDIIFGGAE